LNKKRLYVSLSENFNLLSKKYVEHDLGHRDGNEESDHLSRVHEDIHGAKKKTTTK
jgi:hypothetical protein